MSDIVWVPLVENYRLENQSTIWHPMLRRNAEKFKPGKGPHYYDEPEGDRVPDWEQRIERLRAL